MPPNTADQNRWVERVLGMRVPEPVAFPTRLQALGNELKALRESAIQAPQAVLDAFRGAVAAVKAAAPDAGALVAALEAEIGRLRNPPVDFAALTTRWQAARHEAETALRAIGDGILALDEVAGDPRYPQVRDALDGLPGLLPADTVSALLGAEALPSPALGAIVAYRKALAAVPELPRLEALAAKYARASAVRGPLDAAAAAIEQTLAKAA